MNGMQRLALILILIGAINWGLIGFFRFDLVAALFGTMSPISRLVYSLVGLAGLYGLSLLFAPPTPIGGGEGDRTR